jgi:hypothetical protein
MKPSEIRELNVMAQDKALKSESVSAHEAGLESLKLSLLAEIAAQISEFNHQFGVFRRELDEEFKRIANPLMVVNAESPWSTFATSEGKRITVNRDTVITVSEGSSVIRDDKPTSFITTADREVYKVRGRYEDVCAKCGIPVERQ